MTVLAIAGRELRSLFLSPLAWTLLAVVQLILGYMFVTQIDFFLQLQPRLPGILDAPGVTEIIVAPMLGNAALVLLLIVPLLTMRLLADEFRNRTLPLLFSAPVSMTEIVLGKYLGVIGFIAVLLGLIALMPLSLLVGGTLDIGTMCAGLFGLFLLLSAFAAIGLFMSALTGQPAVAAISTFGALLMLWIIDWSGDGSGGGLLVWLSMVRHYEPLLRGAFSSADVAYYLIVIVTFLVLSARRLDSWRLQH
ncbi:MAG: ABC transporter permease [Gammaproteobacteria bacterium]|jgi:ABC-2 type transport system permease protein|nr:ABC transporter permease [Gammaproteobacteria bacterium]